MNITPLEIRQKEFEKGFRGYDKEDVKAFLNSLSIEWERLNEQTKELKYKLEASEKEVQKLREVENSLFKTLKTAEDTGANMIEQATKTAELHMKETEMKADALMSEAKNRARNIIEDAENKSRLIIDDMEDEIRQLEQVFRSLDANKSTLMSELKMLAEDLLTKIGRHEEFPADIKQHIKKGKDLSRELSDKTEDPIDVEQIIAHNEKEQAEESIAEMTIEQEGEEPIPTLEELDEPLSDQTKQESPEAVAEQEEERMEEEVNTKTSDENDKERGSFFDQFD
jgi:cell division initiation protein